MEILQPVHFIFSFIVALALLALGQVLFPVAPEVCRWGQYLFLGIFLPPALLAGEWLFARVGTAAKILFGLAAVGALAAAALHGPLVGEVPVACLFAAGTWIVAGMARGFFSRMSEAVALLVLTFAAWMTCVRLFWWSSWGSFVVFTPQRMIITCLVLGVAAVYWGHDPESVTRPRGLAGILPDLAALALMVMAAFIPPMASTLEQDFFIGPALLAKHGAHLLWDVPSQYGFLNILLISALPFDDIRVSLYVASALTLLVIQIILYAMLRARRKSLTGVMISLMLTLTLVFQLIYWPSQGAGPQLVPSAGGLRYLFCYVFLAFTWWNARQFEEGRTPVIRRLWTGAMLWAPSVLWNAEGALYASLIWLPQALGLICALEKKRHGALLRRVAWFLARCLVNFVPLVILVAGISGYYVLRIHHLPDWSGFLEYALAYKNGVGTIPVNPTGTVWWLVLMFAVLSAVLAHDVYYRGFIVATPVAGIWGLFFATTSYFVGRSADPNAVVLMAVHLGCFAALLAARKDRSGMEAILAPIMIPPTVVLLTLILGMPALGRFAPALLEDDPVKVIQSQTPNATEQVKALLVRGGYRAGQALVQIDDRLPLAIVDPKVPTSAFQEGVAGFWLPLAPASSFLPLSLERQLVYLDRFMTEHPSGGWLLAPKSAFGEHSLGRTIYDSIGKRYKVSSLVEDKDLILLRFDLI